MKVGRRGANGANGVSVERSSREEERGKEVGEERRGGKNVERLVWEAKSLLRFHLTNTRYPLGHGGAKFEFCGWGSQSKLKSHHTMSAVEQMQRKSRLV